MIAKKHALYALLNQANLSAMEIASLTVSDVHLSDAEPHLTIWDEDTGRREKIAVSPRVKNALVAWLIARPDQPSALLFPTAEGGELSAAEITALLEDYVPPAGSSPVISADLRADEALPEMPRVPISPPFRAAPPPAAPEQVRPYSVEKTPAPPVVAGAESVTIAPRWGRLIIGGLIGLAILGGVIVGAVSLFNRNNDAQPVAAITPTPTDTPIAIDTATPVPTDTPVLATATTVPTDTSIPPTATLRPTDTPTAIPSPTPAPPTATPIPPTATASPTNTPVAVVKPVQPSPTPTTGFKYPAPTLLSPEPDVPFKGGINIHLNWESVGPLAGNEQYALRLVYKHNTQMVYRGTNTQATTWMVPPEFYRDADGPLFDYEWYVYVEQVQPDGSGIAISPESEHRHFTWD